MATGCQGRVRLCRFREVTGILPSFAPLLWLVATASLFTGSRLSAATVEARRAEETLVLKGDQTGSVIRIAPDYLPATWSVATSIFAKGKPKFALPPDYYVRADGDGWWSVARRHAPCVYEWTGAGKDGRWENAANWSPSGVPGRADTIRLAKECTIELERDRMVSNVVFSAKVILAGGAAHAQNTAGRGARAKLGIRAASCLGRVSMKDGATVQPLRGMAGYQGVLVSDADQVTRVALTRPPASYEWTGAALDGAWTSVRNWRVGGRIPMEPPCEQDAVVFPANAPGAKKGILRVVLPPGQTVVSNVVMQTQVFWQGTKSEDLLGSCRESSIDICDLAGNASFTACGENVTVSVRGATDVPLTAAKGVMLALSRHGHRPYRSVTLEYGAAFAPYDWTVEIDRFVIKGGSAIHFWPPRHFNKWRPLWVVHARHLEGNPKLVTDDMSHWRQNVEKWNDGSSMLTVNWKE